MQDIAWRGKGMTRFHINTANGDYQYAYDGSRSFDPSVGGLMKVADFDNDGSSDILWGINGSDIFYFNGIKGTTAVSTGISTYDPSYIFDVKNILNITFHMDHDRDGLLDIMWVDSEGASVIFDWNGLISSRRNGQRIY